MFGGVLQVVSGITDMVDTGAACEGALAQQRGWGRITTGGNVPPEERGTDAVLAPLCAAIFAGKIWNHKSGAGNPGL